jgi:hypothetical protein
VLCDKGKPSVPKVCSLLEARAHLYNTDKALPCNTYSNAQAGGCGGDQSGGCGTAGSPTFCACLHHNVLDNRFVVHRRAGCLGMNSYSMLPLSCCRPIAAPHAAAFLSPAGQRPAVTAALPSRRGCTGRRRVLRLGSCHCVHRGLHQPVQSCKLPCQAWMLLRLQSHSQPTAHDVRGNHSSLSCCLSW